MNNAQTVLNKLKLSLEIAQKFADKCPPEKISKDGLYVPFRFQNKTAEDEKIFEVVPQLFIGTMDGAADLKFIKGLGINHIINLTSGSSQIPNYAEGNDEYEIIYNNFQLKDNIGEDVDRILTAIDMSLKIIDTNLASGRATMVHCNAGLSRSATIIISWLMKSKRMKLLDAVKSFKLIRGRVAVCTPSFWTALFLLEKKLVKARKQKVPVKPTYDYTPHICDDISIESGQNFSIMLATEKEISSYLKKYNYNAYIMIKDLLVKKFGH